jgi:mannose-6-phosphate isomerase-like protein (cupin superfamily)
MVFLALVLALALPQPALATPSPQAPATKKPAAPPTFTLEVKVTDRRGATIPGAEVNLEGPVSREGTTDANGSIVFRNLTAGTYRARVAHERFLTLEKEAVVRAGAPAAMDASLSPAPPPPPAAPPPPAPTPTPPSSPVLTPGLPRALSIPDLVNTKLPGREPVERISVGCSGASASEVLRLRDGLESHTHAEADEMIYIVAGEGTLTMGTNPLKVGPGWFSLVPRGVPHSLTRTGRNPVVLLSMVSGTPCTASALAP